MIFQVACKNLTLGVVFVKQSAPNVGFAHAKGKNSALGVVLDVVKYTQRKLCARGLQDFGVGCTLIKRKVHPT